MPLGLLLQNENKLEEMYNIMTGLHKYMPDPCKLNFELSNGEIYTTSGNTLHPILCGGDQLTACRFRGAQSLGNLIVDAFLMRMVHLFTGTLG